MSRSGGSPARVGRWDGPCAKLRKVISAGRGEGGPWDTRAAEIEALRGCGDVVLDPGGRSWTVRGRFGLAEAWDVRAFGRPGASQRVFQKRA